MNYFIQKSFKKNNFSEIIKTSNIGRIVQFYFLYSKSGGGGSSFFLGPNYFKIITLKDEHSFLKKNHQKVLLLVLQQCLRGFHHLITIL